MCTILQFVLASWLFYKLTEYGTLDVLQNDRMCRKLTPWYWHDGLIGAAF
jgi:hypothetical protein